jgi:hypothetical protein
MTNLTNISEARLAANRANSQHSTGPATTDGKSRSAKNAWRHGLTGQVALMPEEDAHQFTNFCAAIVAEYHPGGAIESQLAQTIAEDFWRLNRARAWETNTLALGYFDGSGDSLDADHPQVQDALTQAVVFNKQAKNFALISLYEQRINRNIEKNQKNLAALQEERRNALRQVAQDATLLARAAAAEAALPQKPKTMAAGQTAAPPEFTAAPKPASTTSTRGFVFSSDQIDRYLDRESRMDRARDLIYRRNKAA